MNDRSVYDVITDRVISLLEQGTVPWHKPWQGGDQLPQNLISRKPYRGVNTFLLHAMAYQSPYWLTFKQAKSLGGNVRKGEKACPVVFWKWLEKEDRAEPNGKSRIPLLRYYSVFNVAQCDGLEDHLPKPEPALPSDPASTTTRILDEANAIVQGMPKRPEIRHGQAGAFYRPSEDYVGMPDLEAFDGAPEYYSTLFHELTHATGHNSRLGRKGLEGTIRFGSPTYSREELIAEMGAAFLCGHAGIVEGTLENSAAYLASWLKRLKEDSKLVVQAAGQAQKAADFILGVKHGESEVGQ